MPATLLAPEPLLHLVQPNAPSSAAPASAAVAAAVAATAASRSTAVATPLSDASGSTGSNASGSQPDGSVAYNSSLLATATTDDQRDAVYWAETLWKDGCAFNDYTGCWPRLWLLGTQKAGTTAMVEMLERQTDACLAETRSAEPYLARIPSSKETHALEGDSWTSIKHHPWKFTGLYQRRHCADGRFLEGTPMNLRDWEAPSRLQEVVPPSWQAQLRLLAILREPVSRDLSLYNHRLWAFRFNTNHFWGARRMMGCHFCASAKSNGSIPPTYEEEAECNLALWRRCILETGSGDARHHRRCVIDSLRAESSRAAALLLVAPSDDGQGLESASGCFGEHRRVASIGTGIYASQLHRWTTFFDRKQLLVLEYEDLKNHNHAYVRKIMEFFGLRFKPGETGTLGDENAHNVEGKVERISCRVRSQMTHAFQPWNDELYQLLEEDHSSGRAPEVEPRFPRFRKRVPCTEDDGSFREHDGTGGDEHDDGNGAADSGVTAGIPEEEHDSPTGQLPVFDVATGTTVRNSSTLAIQDSRL